jgi:hypothetical protein
MKKFKQFVLKYPLVIPIVFFIILRLPSLFEGVWYGDEGIYAAVAQGMHQGKSLYTEVWDHKPPLLEWIYYFSSFWGWSVGLVLVKLSSLIFGIFEIVFLGRILKFITEKPYVINLALIIFAILNGSSVIEANIANAEVFFILFNILIFYLLLRKARAEYIGLVLFLAFMIKPQSFIEGGFMVVIFFLIELLEKKLNWRRYLTIAASFALPVLVYVLILVFQNRFAQFFDAVFIQNFAYVGDYKEVWNIIGLAINPKLVRIGLAITVFLGTLLLFVRKKINRTTVVIVNLLNIEMLLAFVGGRNYPHYITQTLPGWTLLCGLLVNKIYKRIRPHIKITSVAITGITLVWLLGFGIYWPHDEKPGYQRPAYYYSAFIEHVLKKGETSVPIWPDTGVAKRLTSFADYFNKKYSSYKSYYIYTEPAWIIALIDMKATNKYSVWYHLGFSKERMTEAVEAKNKSQLLILDNQAPWKYDEFYKDLDGFQYLEVYNDFIIYRNTKI